MTPTARLAELDRRHLWHPFTQMREWMADDPIIIDRAEGCTLIDTEGRRYIDGVGSIWTNVHGHRVPELDAALKAQLDKVAHSTLLGLSNAPAIELAARLAEVAPPGLTRVFYSDDGATAVEVAVKMAFQFHRQSGSVDGAKRTRFARLEGAYHGDTVGAVSVGAIPLFHGTFQSLLFPATSLPSPHPYRNRWRLRDPDAVREAALAAARELFEKEGDTWAALVIEPRIQGAAGILVHPPGYLAGLRALCDEFGVLLIADEVATGFGRLGHLFACHAEGITPDLMCLAKGLAAGYSPLAATLATERVFAGFLGEYEEFRTFFHGHTFTGHPLGCAVGLKSLELLLSRDLPGNARAMGEYLRGELRKALSDHPHVGEVRGEGLLCGVELVAQRDTCEPFPAGRRAGFWVSRRCRAHGLFTRPLGDVLVFAPPLGIAREDIDTLVAAVALALREELG